MSQHAPFEVSWSRSGFMVSALMEPSAPGGLFLDQVQVWPIEGGIRVAITDPALSFEGGPSLAQLAGAQALANCAPPASLLGALSAANEQAFDQEASRAGFSRSTCLLVADILPGRVSALSAGDCEMWVDCGDGMFPLIHGDCLTPAARAEFSMLAAPQSDRLNHLKDHDRLLGIPSKWACPPVGQFAEVFPRAGDADDVLSVMIFTDGFSGLPQFSSPRGAHALAHDRPPSWPHPSPHGDLAIVFVTLPAL